MRTGEPAVIKVRGIIYFTDTELAAAFNDAITALSGWLPVSIESRRDTATPMSIIEAVPAWPGPSERALRRRYR